ncbi:MAG: 23S rRNA (uracil(1939)-C(5))-methyltransferase RlmD [Sphaerochaetaceae bacterium]|jgi:23S rRNA (uracil1939-C5)-methyltransferase|nr:23S rRNA (uracil(1939)-C(5))-methyltransferase RlmD [Sphaerochaetaceae bacterium]
MNYIEICPYADRCGGCQLQGVSYREQLNEKMDMVEDVLDYYSPIAPIIGMENPTNYRNKSQSVYGLKKGNVINGIYRSHSHEIVPVKVCMLQDKETDVIFQTVNELMGTLGIEPYDEDMNWGVIRHVLVKKSFSTGQIMVVIVSGTRKIPHKKDFLKLLLTRHPNIETILLNINNEQTSMVLGPDDEEILYGQGYIEDELCGLRFRISAKSFYQENSVQAAKLYNIAMKMAQLKSTDKVMDAYCGTGTIGLVAAKEGIEHLIGIENNKQAVKDAEVNAKLNNITNAEFICADASAYCKTLAKAKEHIDVLFLDPPRSGSDERFLASAMKLGPDKIIYISCNIDTLERDLRYIERFGDYKVRGIQPVDMFPFTTHIECIVLIEKEYM